MAPKARERGVLPIPQTYDVLDFPADGRYAGHWAEVWVNPPDRLAAEWTPETQIAAILVQVIKAWSFADPEHPDQPLPITLERLGDVPSEALLWLYRTYFERRNDPLLRPKPTNSRASMEESLT